jgi:P-type Cu+ transporter
MHWSKPMHDHDHPHAPSGGIGEAALLEKDPVCGMNVDPGSAKHSAEYGVHTYFFCSQGCKTKFVAHPARYVEAKWEAPVPAGTIYTCPMHPEIRQTGPGLVRSAAWRSNLM